ncbi:MAG: phospholipase A [Clostridia bacterium]
MKRLPLFAFLLLLALAARAAQAAAPEWILATADARPRAGERFQVIVLGPAGATLPDSLEARLRSGAEERILRLEAQAPALGERRLYDATLPADVLGAVELDLPGRASSVLILIAEAPPPVAAASPAPVAPAVYAGSSEPPLSENDPMYFVLGARQGYSARFQLSFKYRLFDPSSGFGQGQPWLSGFYFGYTQNSLWDLSAESKPFRDTSYRPSLFWKWERTDDRTWIDALRLGIEHESNGGGPGRSRSINILFARPEWRWSRPDGERVEFTPKIYGYLDKDENPDINHYRGNVDWRVRWDSGNNWIATGVARLPDSGKGSLLLDASRRVRDLRFGPVGGYLHFQFFTGYGEDILDYNVRRKTQFRIGFAIVP